MPDTRILIVAGDLLARAGLAAMLNMQPGLTIVGQSAGADTLETDLAVYRPDVAVVDLGYEPTAYVGEVRALVDADLSAVLLLPDADSAGTLTATLQESAAYGLLLRDTSAEQLASAVQTVQSGLIVIAPEMAALLVPESPEQSPPPLLENLTPRESEVLQLLAEGLANKAIALRLSISPNTVKFHVNAILSKLDAQSRTEAVVRATQLGLILL